ncbi:MAG: ribonuclease P protein component, partial [Niameybacter sp.]
MKYTISLKKTPEFRNVYRRGRSVANRFLVLYKYKNGKENNRIGISVSKKVGNS